MLTGLGMTFEGRQHSGIDDSHNISRILKELAQLGHVFVNTTAIKTWFNKTVIVKHHDLE